MNDRRIKVLPVFALIFAVLSVGSAAADSGSTGGWFEQVGDGSNECLNKWEAPPSSQPVALTSSYSNGGQISLWMSDDHPVSFVGESARPKFVDDFSYAINVDYRRTGPRDTGVFPVIPSGFDLALGTSTDPNDYDFSLVTRGEGDLIRVEPQLTGPVLLDDLDGERALSMPSSPGFLTFEDDRCGFDKVDGPRGSRPGENETFHSHVRVKQLELDEADVCPGTYALVPYPNEVQGLYDTRSEFEFQWWDSGTFPQITVLPSTNFRSGCAMGTCVELENAAQAAAFEVCPDGSDPSPSWFHGLEPTRLFDTRTADSPSGLIPSDGQLDVQVAGAMGVPSSGVTAVVMNVTLTEATQPGFVTVWPQGSPRPRSSNINVVRAAQTVPNLVVVPLGPTGKVSFFVKGGGHLFSDLAGYFSTDFDESGSRFVSIDPVRAFDTRTSEAPSGFVADGDQITVKVTGIGGVPSTGVRGVVMNTTATEAAAAGFVTVWPGSAERPIASNLNLIRGDTNANLVFVPVSADGTVTVFSRGGAHVIGDITGYFTKPTIEGAGTFMGSAPTRMMDTRETDVLAKLFPGLGIPEFLDPGDDQFVSTVDLVFLGAATIVNLTATETTGPGFITAWADGEPRPGTSSLNVSGPNETRANLAVVPLGGGNFRLFSKSGAHLVVDAFGVFRD